MPLLFGLAAIAVAFVTFFARKSENAAPPAPAPNVEPAKPSPLPVPAVPHPTQIGANCDVSKEPVHLQYSAIGGVKQHGDYMQPMPVTKPVAHEAHYVVRGLDSDNLKGMEDQLQPHLDRTCALLHGKWAPYYPGLSAKCSEVYTRSSSGKSNGTTQWTPAEGGGAVGHGVGALYPSVECEAATGNQYWASGARPAAGTRYLATNPANGKSFVLCMGYEAGPGEKDHGGGVSTEALYYLVAKHGSTLTLGRAIDQTLPYGPVVCQK